jgi:hypothetical protein
MLRSLFSRIWHRIVCQIVANLPSLKMEAASSPDMTVAIYRTNWAYITEDTVLQSPPLGPEILQKGPSFKVRSCR